MHIVQDDLTGAAIQGLLREHRASMFAHSPPESVHALDVDGLRQPEISFWSVWEGRELLGCGALKQLSPSAGEIKSMRTATVHLRKGVATTMLEHILHTARSRGYCRLYLETGTTAAFAPAHRLYQRHGFAECPPFADYRPDPFSVFMVKALR